MSNPPVSWLTTGSPPPSAGADADRVVAGLDLARGVDELVERPGGQEQGPAHPDQDGDDEGQRDEPGERPELRDHERHRRDERADDEQEEQAEDAAEPAVPSPTVDRIAAAAARLLHPAAAPLLAGRPPVAPVPAGGAWGRAAVPLATARLLVGRHPSPARSSANR